MIQNIMGLIRKLHKIFRLPVTTSDRKYIPAVIKFFFHLFISSANVFVDKLLECSRYQLPLDVPGKTISVAMVCMKSVNEVTFTFQIHCTEQILPKFTAQHTGVF